MRRRISDWLGETHGTRFELLRHFLPRFFDSELVASTGDWTRVAAGALAMLASSWIVLASILVFKYRRLAEMNLRDRFAIEIQADLVSLTCLAVCLTILLVAALWQSLYPALRDYLVLTALPVSAADIFVAKFSALAAVFSVFVVVLTLPASIVLYGVTGAAVATSFVTIAAACAIAFFGLIAMQGIFLNVLPVRLFERITIWIQAMLASVSLAGLTLVAGKGQAIIDALHLESRDLFLAAIFSPIVAVLAYLASFHRHRRLLLEAPQPRAPQRRDLGSRFLDFCIRDPREQAALAFIWKTMHRSRIHRLAILIYWGLAVAWILKSGVDQPAGSAKVSDFDRMMATAFPIALILFTLLGLRHLFRLPAELRANWMFQIAEREGRRAWLNAVEHFVLGCGVAPLVFAGGVFIAWSGGLLTAVAWAAVAFFLAAIGFEYLFRDWRKLPFTCSYLPGKRPLIANAGLFVGLMPFLLPIAWIVYRSATNPAACLIVLSAEFALWSAMRRSRLTRWGILPLRYEELPESEIDSFGLSEEGTILAQEQFQREWSDYLRHGPDAPILHPLEAGETRIGRLREWLRAVPQDLRYSLRMLLRKPGFALTMTLTLGLGLGLNAAFFTVFNAFLLRPLAVRDPASLVSIEFHSRYRTPIPFTPGNYESLASGTAALSELTVSTVEGTGLDGRSAFIGLVGGNYFGMLGSGIALGRPFRAGEPNPVLVLNHRTWQTRYGADENILGRKLLVDRVPFEVIGVASPEFAGVPVGTIAVAAAEYARYGAGAADIWVPIDVWNRTPELPRMPVRGIIGRLRAGVSAERAQAMLTAYARRLTEDRVHYDEIFRVGVSALDIPVTWTALRYCVPLLIAFGLTMLIPCANAANMMLARAMARQRELGVRLSLGAGRGRLVRQLLTESLVLSVLAAAAGLALARVALGVFSSVIHATAPPTILFKFRIPDFPIDAHVYFYMVIVAGVTTVVFALAPAAQATRLAVASAIRGEFGAIRVSRFRDALVTGQVAACVMLLATASVLLRGTARVAAIDRGYDARGVYGVANQSPEDARALIPILEREPWLDTLAVMGSPPNEMGSLQVGSSTRPGWRSAYYQRSTGEFLRLVRISLLRGRAFAREEEDNNAPVVVVSEQAAGQLWPGEDPIGKTLFIQPGQRENWRLPRFPEAKVIGVSGDIISKAKDGGPRPSLYFPAALSRGMVVAVRGRGTPEQTLRQLDAALARAPGAAHGARVVALQETIDWEAYPQQAASWLSSILGLVALLLTISGIYGVMSYLVSQRTKEIGIRIALGATQRHVARFILAYSGRLAGAGLLFGTVLALGVLQYSASKIDLMIDLYDIPAYSLSLAAVAVTALVATLGPTRRACGIDPQDSLRSD